MSGKTIVAVLLVFSLAACETAGVIDISNSVASSSAPSNRQIIGTLTEAKFANVPPASFFQIIIAGFVGPEGEITNISPRDEKTKAEILDTITAGLTSPGVFTGKTGPQYQIVIRSLIWKDVITVAQVLVGAATARATGIYALLNVSGNEIRTDEVSTETEASFDDSITARGRTRFARLKAIFENIQAYRAILLANADEINRLSQ